MKKRPRLLWQIFLPFLIILLLSSVLLMGYGSRTLNRFFMDQVTDELKGRAYILEKTVVDYLEPLDFKQIDRRCKTLGDRASTRITVILPDGRVVGDSHENPKSMDNHSARIEVIRAISEGFGSAIRFSSTLRQRMMYVATPIMQKGKILAVMRTSIPVTAIDETLRNLWLQIGIAGVIIILIAGAVSLWVSRHLSRPLVEMKQGADKFARGILDHRLPVPKTEEMAGVSKAMNQMAAQLDERLKTVLSQRNEFETVLASMSEGIVALDREEKIINLNPAAARMLESSPTLKGRSLEEVVRNPELQRFVKQAMADEAPLEKDIALHRNEERVLYVHSTPLRNTMGETIGSLIVLNDVTQLRKLEKMRRDFVDNVSHEIKTPLTAIKGFVETLRYGKVEAAEETERFLNIILKHVDRLSSIIEDLMKLSRIEREEESRSLRRSSCKVCEIMYTAVQVCQKQAEKKGIRVELDCDKNLSANIDGRLIEQAAINLLENAVKYSPEKASVQVTVSASESEIVFEFKDFGDGIAKEHLSRIFERFYRVDKARSRELGGTGLGLSIVKHIVQAHGGDVAVESTPGKGSTFRIALPK